MELQELKQKSNSKILLRGESGSGKTNRACKLALRVSREGGDVLYVDTEAEGSTTMVNLVESQDAPYDESDLANVEYVQAGSYGELMDNIGNSDGRQAAFDLVVVDTLDHKHSYVLKHVTDAKRESGADWQEYASIYAEEKELMEQIGKPEANIVATLDPSSGGMDKPKGAQTNVHGYFTIVLDLMVTEDDYKNKIRNWVGHGDKRGVMHPNLIDKLTEVIMNRVQP